MVMLVKNIEWLESLKPAGWKLGLGMIKRLLRDLGNPHLGLNYVHVGGTNGKGSVCAMIYSVLRHAGYSTGRFTSPCLFTFSEQIVVNGECISKHDIERLLGEIRKHYSGQSHFEVCTALAFLYFREKKPDIVVMEVGLGGRVDSTNVITPLVSVITNVSLEHTEYLGDTIEKIAREKSGIIKKGVPIVTLAKNSINVIREEAMKKYAEVIVPSYKEEDGMLWLGNNKFALSLKGSFQIGNAALAVSAIDALKLNGFRISDKAVREGLADTVWPCRMESIGKVLADCAHNPAGIRAIADEMKKMKFRKLICVTGMLSDKDKRKSIGILSECCDYFIFSNPCSERAAEPSELAPFTSKPYEIIPDPNKALQKAIRICGKDELILATGSIYMIGNMKYLKRNVHTQGR